MRQFVSYRREVKALGRSSRASREEKGIRVRGMQCPATSVKVVRADGSVGWRLGELTTTPGLVVVADCAACDGTSTSASHTHSRWRVQTENGYRVGDFSVSRRSDAHDAAGALKCVQVDWSHVALVVDLDPTVQVAALSIISRWGLTRATA